MHPRHDPLKQCSFYSIFSALSDGTCCRLHFDGEMGQIGHLQYHHQPCHPARACVCMLCLNNRTSTTETDHHRSSSHDQWANSRHQSCKGAPRKVPESHRRSRSSIHNHNIWPWCHYDSYANNSHIYSKHIVLIGSFHTITNALKIAGHKMAGSGYAEILVEANLVTSGCLQWVLSDENYAKSLWYLKAVDEGLECLLFTTFMDNLVQNSPHRTSNIAALSSLGTVSP